ARDRGRVDEGLEDRAGLAAGLEGAVELRVVEVTAADQRPDFARPRIERDDEALEVRRLVLLAAHAAGLLHSRVLRVGVAGLRLDAREARLERRLRRALEIHVQRRDDAQAAAVDVVA